MVTSNCLIRTYPFFCPGEGEEVPLQHQDPVGFGDGECPQSSNLTIASLNKIMPLMFKTAYIQPNLKSRVSARLDIVGL